MFLANAFQLLLRRSLRHEVIHPSLGRDGRRREWVVARNHHSADAHFAKMRKALLDSALYHVIQMDDAEHFAALCHDERCAARARDFVNGLAHGLGKLAARLIRVNPDGICRAFADGTGGLTVERRKIHTAHACLCSEGHERGVHRCDFAGAQVELLLRQHHDRAAFGGFIRE